MTDIQRSDFERKNIYTPIFSRNFKLKLFIKGCWFFVNLRGGGKERVIRFFMASKHPFKIIKICSNLQKSGIFNHINSFFHSVFQKLFNHSINLSSWECFSFLSFLIHLREWNTLVVDTRNMLCKVLFKWNFDSYLSIISTHIE